MSKSVGNLSLIEKVGRMFIVGLDGTEPDETIMELIQTYKIGGVVLYENNIQSAEQLLSLLTKLKSMNTGNEVPLFLAISEEGGRANVLPKEIVKLPAIKYIADSGDKNLVYESANHIGKILSSFGFNINFWPIFDLGGSVYGRPLSDRCISNNPVIVSSYGECIIKGLNENNIIAVPKYFPGHSTTKNSNSKVVIPHTNKSLSKLEQLDLMPFKAAIENNIEALLVGNINVSKLNLFAPATMSYKVITRLLKGRYNFQGVTICDDLTSTAVDIQYGVKSSTRKAILAGADIMIIRDEKKVKGVLEDIAKQIKNGNIEPNEVDARVQKILDLKDKFNLSDTEITELEVKKLNDETEILLEKIRK